MAVELKFMREWEERRETEWKTESKRSTQVEIVWKEACLSILELLSARRILDCSEDEAHSCLSQRIQNPKLSSTISLGLELFSPSYVGVSDFLGLKIWRIHVDLWRQTKNRELVLTAREKYVTLALTVKDPGTHMWEAIPRSSFLGTGENREVGKTNSSLWESKMQL